jgi:hypothetical protein
MRLTTESLVAPRSSVDDVTATHLDDREVGVAKGVKAESGIVAMHAFRAPWRYSYANVVSAVAVEIANAQRLAGNAENRGPSPVTRVWVFVAR